MDLSQLESEYSVRCATPSDINEHLPTLRQYAAQVSHITEFGVDTSANSTVAMMAARPKRMISYDLQDLDVQSLASFARSADVDWVFHRANVLDVEIDNTDLLFIDSWHHYLQLKAEFELHADKVRQYIVMHDTEIYRDVGSGNYSGGLWQGIEEAVATGEWTICYSSVANNGLTILERRCPPPIGRSRNMVIVEQARRLGRIEFGDSWLL